MDEFAFADLVTASPGIRITHIPTFLNRTAAPYGTVFGHISRQNPQSKFFRWQPARRDRVPRSAQLHLAHLVHQAGIRAHLELRRGARHRTA
jgi:hypothetical protein